jgi:hypothetical protein
MGSGTMEESMMEMTKMPNAPKLRSQRTSGVEVGEAG